MGEGLAAPTAAAAVVILDVSAVHRSLVSTLSHIIPTPSSSAPALTSDDISLAGLSVSAVSLDLASSTVQSYVAQMTAHLVVYDTQPTQPLNGVIEDAWKYALATTETGQWKGESRHCTALHCTALHCTALHCTALSYTVLHCTALIACLHLYDV